MRKPELVAAIAEKADLTKEKASEVVTVITEQIANCNAIFLNKEILGLFVHD